MVTYLLIISLILHIGTILWIVVLMQKLNRPPLERESFDVEKAKREIEDLLVAYTAEMKAGNERLLDELIELKEKNQEAIPSIQKSELHDNSRKLQQQKKSQIPSSPIIHVPKIAVLSNVEEANDEERFSNYQPPNINETKEDIFEQSDTLKVLTLAKQGLNVGEIAKKLNMGKGEVELLLKFYQ